jgi:hypothetical protein
MTRVTFEVCSSLSVFSFRWKNSTGVCLRAECFVSKCRINFDGVILLVDNTSQHRTHCGLSFITENPYFT